MMFSPGKVSSDADTTGSDFIGSFSPADPASDPAFSAGARRKAICQKWRGDKAVLGLDREGPSLVYMLRKS